MPSASAYENLFGLENLSGLVQSFMQEPGNRVCTGLFRQGRPLMPDGDTASWDEVQMHRHVAPITGRDGPHQKLQGEIMIPRSSAMMNIKVYKDLPAGLLFSERAPGSMMADARMRLELALADLTKVIGNAIELACSQILSTGSLTVNTSNFPGSEVVFTVSWSPNTYTKTADWATAASPLLSSEMILMKRSARNASGMSPAIAVANAGVEGYLVQNTEITSFAAPLLGPAMLQNGANLVGEMLPALRVGGLNWQIADGVYVPQGGSATQYFTADRVAVLPADLGSVLGLAEGYGVVPSGPVFSNGGAVGLQQAPARGAYAYTEVKGDVPSIRLYAGWVGLPVLLFPSGLTVATVS